MSSSLSVYYTPISSPAATHTRAGSVKGACLHLLRSSLALFTVFMICFLLACRTLERGGLLQRNDKRASYIFTRS